MFLNLVFSVTFEQITFVPDGCLLNTLKEFDNILNMFKPTIATLDTFDLSYLHTP